MKKRILISILTIGLITASSSAFAVTFNDKDMRIWGDAGVTFGPFGLDSGTDIVRKNNYDQDGFRMGGAFGITADANFSYSALLVNVALISQSYSDAEAIRAGDNGETTGDGSLFSISPQVGLILARGDNSADPPILDLHIGANIRSGSYDQSAIGDAQDIERNPNGVTGFSSLSPYLGISDVTLFDAGDGMWMGFIIGGNIGLALPSSFERGGTSFDGASTVAGLLEFHLGFRMTIENFYWQFKVLSNHVIGQTEGQSDYVIQNHINGLQLAVGYYY